MQFRVAGYQIGITVNYVETGFLFGFEIDYWKGEVTGRVETFKHVIAFSIEKGKRETPSIGYKSNGR